MLSWIRGGWASKGWEIAEAKIQEAASTRPSRWRDDLRCVSGGTGWSGRRRRSSWKGKVLDDETVPEGCCRLDWDLVPTVVLEAKAREPPFRVPSPLLPPPVP